MQPRDGLRFRGIDYDTGTAYVRKWNSRPDWSEAALAADLSVIRDTLHANAVTVFGSEPDRLLLAAEHAVSLGLHVWVQPRPIDVQPSAAHDEVLLVAQRLGDLAARLGGDGATRLRLNIGCEFSVFLHGMLPGRSYAQRGALLRWTWPLLPVANRRLNRLLATIVDDSRRVFPGQITYGAGAWESVDWDPFDAIGLNHYRDVENRSTYRQTVERAVETGKPVLVTELGCCGFVGAAELGAAGDGVVSWREPSRPTVRSGIVRDESVQAREIGELLTLVQAAGVVGAFVFELVEPTYPRSADPRQDLDVASFGVLAVDVDDRGEGPTYRTTPKAAFYEIAARYANWSVPQ